MLKTVPAVHPVLERSAAAALSVGDVVRLVEPANGADMVDVGRYGVVLRRTGDLYAIAPIFLLATESPASHAIEVKVVESLAAGLAVPVYAAVDRVTTLPSGGMHVTGRLDDQDLDRVLRATVKGFASAHSEALLERRPAFVPGQTVIPHGPDRELHVTEALLRANGHEPAPGGGRA